MTLVNLAGAAGCTVQENIGGSNETFSIDPIQVDHEDGTDTEEADGSDGIKRANGR